MDEMSDLEITKLCAEAMGFSWSEPMPIDHQVFVWVSVGTGSNAHGERYDPLHSDAQAMALVKRFDLCIGQGPKSVYTRVNVWTGMNCEDEPGYSYAEDVNGDLNRAICLCVANLQMAKHEA